MVLVTVDVKLLLVSLVVKFAKSVSLTATTSSKYNVHFVPLVVKGLILNPPVSLS